jgi:hypothetical protein
MHVFRHKSPAAMSHFSAAFAAIKRQLKVGFCERFDVAY